MKAAVLTEYGEPLEIEDVPAPNAPAHGVVVETEACGICRSDWHGWQGDWNTPLEQIMGHEPAGTIIEVGDDVETVDVGDRVAVPFNLADGTCHLCQTGHQNVCENRLPLGFAEPVQGAFAEQFAVPNADVNVVHLPDGVRSVDMAALGCRFMTSFHGLSHRADLESGDWVAIHGIGGVGLSAVQIATALGANVVAVDIDEGQLEEARAVGADETVNAETVGDVPETVHEITDGGAHVAVDALGIEETVQNSIDSLRRRGQHVQIGLATGEDRAGIPIKTDDLVRKEIDILGSYGMQPPRYDEIFRMIDRGKLDPSQVISDTVSLEDTSGILADMTTFETQGINVITEF